LKKFIPVDFEEFGENLGCSRPEAIIGIFVALLDNKRG
jgi:hypothetical protein